jgi:hypothetical protein
MVCTLPVLSMTCRLMCALAPAMMKHKLYSGYRSWASCVMGSPCAHSPCTSACSSQVNLVPLARPARWIPVHITAVVFGHGVLRHNLAAWQDLFTSCTIPHPLRASEAAADTRCCNSHSWASAVSTIGSGGLVKVGEYCTSKRQKIEVDI